MALYLSYATCFIVPFDTEAAVIYTHLLGLLALSLSHFYNSSLLKPGGRKRNSLNTISIWLVWYFLFNINKHRHTGSTSIMFKICRIWQSQVSKVSTVIMLQAGPYGVQILVEIRELSIFQNIQTRSGTNSPPTQGYWGLFPWGKVASAQGSPVTTIHCQG